jgi:hypothetical protein
MEFGGDLQLVLVLARDWLYFRFGWIDGNNGQLWPGLLIPRGFFLPGFGWGIYRK